MKNNVKKAIEVAKENIASLEKPAKKQPKSRLSRGQKLLIRAARRLVESRFAEAGLTPVSTQSCEIKSWEHITILIGRQTPAEQELFPVLELISDLLVGRDLFKPSDLEAILNADILAEAGEVEEMEAHIKRFNRPYSTGVIRNIGLRQPDYDPVKRFEEMRRNPDFRRLLKSTSNKRVHVVLFGTLYSFGKKKAAAAAGK